MPDLKDILVRIRGKKKERKVVHNIYKDLKAQSKPYQEVLDQLNSLKAKKLQLENTLQSQCAKEIETAERLALDIKNDEQVLSDMALTKFMKGETIELTDENDVKYEPVFKVTFKKIT